VATPGERTSSDTHEPMMMQQAHGALLRRRVRVRGVVQGVGFRPYVHGLATQLRLSGSVLNDGARVFADVQGFPTAVEAFCARWSNSRT